MLALERELGERYNDKEARIRMDGAIRDDLVRENMMVIQTFFWFAVQIPRLVLPH